MSKIAITFDVTPDDVPLLVALHSWLADRDYIDNNVSFSSNIAWLADVVADACYYHAANENSSDLPTSSDAFYAAVAVREKLLGSLTAK